MWRPRKPRKREPLKPIIRVEAGLFVVYLEIRDMYCSKPMLAFVLPYPKFMQLGRESQKPHEVAS
jgi:hypothetical protein